MGSILLLLALVSLLYFGLKRGLSLPGGFVQGLRTGLAGDSFPISVGKYVTGLPDIADSLSNMVCVIDENNFIFQVKGKRPLGRIPRDRINQIIADDKSRISERITVPRILALGIFALAAKKQKKTSEWYMVIDWDDQSGVKQNTVFEFTGVYSQTQVNQAANLLRKHLKPKTSALAPDEKKCPACAEVIKAAARVCRYCGSNLS